MYLEIDKEKKRLLHELPYTEMLKSATMCQTHGDDVDDEEFTIQIKFNIFAMPEVDPRITMEKVESTAQVNQGHF